MGWEDALDGGGHGTPLQYSRLENPMRRGAWPWGCKDSDMTEVTKHACTHVIINKLSEGISRLLN